MRHSHTSCPASCNERDAGDSEGPLTNNTRPGAVPGGGTVANSSRTEVVWGWWCIALTDSLNPGIAFFSRGCTRRSDCGGSGATRIWAAFNPRPVPASAEERVVEHRHRSNRGRSTQGCRSVRGLCHLSTFRCPPPMLLRRGDPLGNALVVSLTVHRRDFRHHRSRLTQLDSERTRDPNRRTAP